MTTDILSVFKVLVIGASGIGKTTLVHRYVDRKFLPDFKPTIGVDFSLKNVLLADIQPGHSIALQIWDMAGEERFQTILSFYGAGAHGLILVFDSTDYRTLRQLEQWYEIVSFSITDNTPVILISTKHDLPDSKTIPDIISIFEKNHKIDLYIPTSAKDGSGVDSTFQKLTHLIARTYKLLV